MGRRAVGGASAVGCGVFGLGGLLIGVAIVVWLGSIALDGSKDAIDGGKPKQTATTVAAPQSEGPGAFLSVTPPTGLGDGDEVRVHGAVLPPGPIRLTVCLTHPTTAALAAPGGGCDEATATIAAADAKTMLSTTRTVPRVVTIEGKAYDCAAAPGACSLWARSVGTSDDGGLSAPLQFASGLPPVDAEAPPTS